jgi:hypothetical protein
MGLLANFLGLSPDQTQGLLGFSAAMGDAAQPSAMPKVVNLGSGMMGYQNAIRAAQDRQQQQALYDLKLRSLKGEVSDQEKARQDALDAQDWFRKRSMGTQTDATAPVRAVLGNDLSPTVDNAAKLAAAAPPQQNMSEDFFNQRVAQAAAMRASGNPLLMAQADKVEEAALKFKPKYSTDFRAAIGTDGKLHNYVLADDGTVKDAGVGVKPDLKTIDLGGTQQFYDANSTAPGTVLKKTITPGEAAANALGLANLGVSRDRLAFDKDNASKPVFNADAGGWVMPPSDDNPAGKLLPVAGVSGKPPTEFQGKSAAYGLRAKESDKILTGLQGQYSPAAINSKNTVSDWPVFGGTMGAITNKFALSPTDQRAEQAQRDFVNAVLRQESGAAISPAEFENAGKQYFPQPGDSDAVIAQKARNRQLAIQGFDANAGKATLTATTPPATPSKMATLSDIAVTARATGKSTKQVTADMRAAGYTIGGQ